MRNGGESPPAVAKDILWEEEKRYSLVHEEVIIRDFFQDEREGLYVDIGCSFPVKNNNTYYLEKHLGWSGISVDALPDYARSWARRRPDATFVNSLVTDREAAEKSFYKAPVWGLSSAENAGDAKTPRQEIKVPATTLDALLEAHGVKDLDFVSIDVEGHHEEVLAGFDLARWKPRLVAIEDNGLYTVPWFRERGYEPMLRYRPRDVANWYYAPADVASQVDARHSEVGARKLRELEEKIAASPMDATFRIFHTPLVVLDADRNPVVNEDHPNFHKGSAAAP